MHILNRYYNKLLVYLVTSISILLCFALLCGCFALRCVALRFVAINVNASYIRLSMDVSDTCANIQVQIRYEIGMSCMYVRGKLVFAYTNTVVSRRIGMCSVRQHICG